MKKIARALLDDPGSDERVDLVGELCPALNVGGAMAALFSIPAYEAMQADGECGPDASAFEGLK